MKNKLITIGIIIACIVFLVTWGPVKDAYWTVKAFIDPQLNEEFNKAYSIKSDEFLFWKLGSWSEYEARTAAGVLESRKDIKYVPRCIKLLKSGNKFERGAAIEILGVIGDIRAINPLMEAMHNDKDPDNRTGAMISLSRMKYEPIITEIRKLAETRILHSEVPQDNAIMMCEMFGKNPKTIEILKYLNTAKGFKFTNDDASDALKRIGSKKENNGVRH